jgi:hypothetical protein
MQALRLEPAWGRDAHQLLREEFRHSIAILVLAEDLPEAHNRVALTDRMEADGLPAVKVEYTLSEHSRRSLDFGLDRAEEVLRAAGAHRVVRLPLAPLTGWHLLSTARMGTDPATSVTDARGPLPRGAQPAGCRRQPLPHRRRREPRLHHRRPRPQARRRPRAGHRMTPDFLAAVIDTLLPGDDALPSGTRAGLDPRCLYRVPSCCIRRIRRAGRRHGDLRRR